MVFLPPTIYFAGLGTAFAKGRALLVTMEDHGPVSVRSYDNAASFGAPTTLGQIADTGQTYASASLTDDGHALVLWASAAGGKSPLDLMGAYFNP